MEVLGLFLQPTLMHNSITTCMSHYYPRHVSGLDTPILRRNNCTNTASGILALLRGCTLHRFRADCSLLSTASFSWNPQGLSRPVMGLLYLDRGKSGHAKAPQYSMLRY